MYKFYGKMRVVLLGFFSIVFVEQSLALDPLQFETAKVVKIPEILTFNGTVEAVNQGTASAQTSGRVVEAFFDVGDLVEKDAIMLRLEDSRQLAEYNSAMASVEAAKANNIAVSKEFSRIKQVYKKKLISKANFDNTLAKRDAAQAALKVAEARLKNAEVQLEYTKIRAPYQGIVLERHIEVGETVNIGTPVYSGMSLEFMRVKVKVPQKDIYQIRKFKHAMVLLPSGQVIDIVDSSLTFFGQADPQTSSFRIRLQLPRLDDLYPGMYLKTSFQIGVKQALVVPLTSVIHRGEVTAVYLQKESGDLAFRHILTGSTYQNQFIEILSGLNMNESVVTNPALVEQVHYSK